MVHIIGNHPKCTHVISLSGYRYTHETLMNTPGSHNPFTIRLQEALTIANVTTLLRDETAGSPNKELWKQCFKSACCEYS